MNEKYYKLLKADYASKTAILTEIVNLNAICELPKGTEHFMSDVHGEYYAFNHVLRNGSGSIKEKIEECYPAFSMNEVAELAVLIYYPVEKLKLIREGQTIAQLKDWYHERIIELLRVARLASKKYTHSKVRKALPESFRYIIEELLAESIEESGRRDYFESIIQKIIDLDQAEELIRVLADTIRRLTVDHLHIVGDIYDRGPYPDLIIEQLISLPSVDVQWGNHDIVWMAIRAGSPLAMMNAIRISARYGNLDIIEESYGISLRPFVSYAEKHYKPSKAFEPHLLAEEKNLISSDEKQLLNKLQQAAAILQFKLESQLIARRPEFHLEARDVLQYIDYDDQTITLAGKTYPLIDFQAPTVDPVQPSALTAEESALLKHLLSNFQASEKLRRHIDFLLSRGAMYRCYNGNLLFHGCIPLQADGSFEPLEVNGTAYAGKKLLDFYEKKVRESFKNPSLPDDFATDLLWYLWVGETSSLFGKQAMTTFERYYIADKATHEEKKNPYYQLRNSEETARTILAEFGLAESGHIINGHTPVKEKDGENPVKANGRFIVIDGGFSKPYQATTGIAGYTLLYNSYGIRLAAHQAFGGIEDAVKNGTDIVSVKRLVDAIDTRIKVRDTTVGEKLRADIADLEYLFKHYDAY